MCALSKAQWAADSAANPATTTTPWLPQSWQKKPVSRSNLSIPAKRNSRRLPAARLHEDQRQDGLQEKMAGFAPNNCKSIADNGAYSAKAPAITGVATMRHDTCYKYSDVKIDAKLVYTNKVPPEPSRLRQSLGGMGGRAGDRPGRPRAGIDPIEIARINAAEVGYVSPHGNRVTSCELKQCLDMVDK